MHFLLIGMAIFAGHHLLSPTPDRGAPSGRIELTEDDLRQMTVVWLAQGRPAPTPAQMQSLVEARVREEILYREALVLGLDQGDTIVKRRMAQKMAFLLEDVAALREPTPDELRAWFANHAGRFALPRRVSFRHLYFSPDRRGQRAREAAARALPGLPGKAADWPAAAAVADPFMFQDHYGDRSFDQLASLFGPKFADAVFRITPGSWQGPIESGYGWHLVWVDSVTEGRVPLFEEIESEVRSEWMAEQRAQVKGKAFEVMRARYEVVLPGPAATVAADSSAAPTKAAP